jgi:hypothetical protein
MSSTSPNLGLKVWDQPTDSFHSTELADNWQALDQHDHTGPPNGLKLGQNALNANSVGTVQIKDGEVTRNKIVDGAINGQKIENGAVTLTKLGVNTLATGTFYTYLNAAVPSVSTDTLVKFVENYDVSNWYDPATGLYTPLQPGYYRLSASLRPSAALTAGKSIRAVIYRNGTAWVGGTVAVQSGTTDPVSSTVTCNVFANGSGDNYAVWVAHTNGGTITLAGASLDCYFHGEYIGK